MNRLSRWFKFDRLSLALALSTLLITALTRLLPFAWMETAAQWGVLALLIAFILGCATLLIVSLASLLPRAPLARTQADVKVRRNQVIPVYAITASTPLKKK